MRQKDFNEVAKVLGNEVRLCDTPIERAGLEAAFNALVGHAAHRYPEVDTMKVMVTYTNAIREEESCESS